jgi:H+/Cl- antiporter ClcA
VPTETAYSRRGYLPSDMPLIANIGCAAGCIAVLVFTLYINAEPTRGLYKRPELLWLIPPVLLYWITRVWFFASRGALHEDPVIFALKDSVSHMTFGLLILIVIASVV